MQNLETQKNTSDTALNALENIINEEISARNNSSTNNDTDKKQLCKGCGKNRPLLMFIHPVTKDEKKGCMKCFEKRKRKREKQKKDPNYVAGKVRWRKKRAEIINELGIDAYLKLNAEHARKQREKNPEKLKRNQEKKRKNPLFRLKYYKNAAKNKDIKWNLTDELALSMFKTYCSYCHEKLPEYLNGIDRVDSAKDYDYDNCVACCDMCNIMKNTFTRDEFIDICRHMLTNLGIINGINYINHKLFRDCISMTYKATQLSAIKRNILCELTEVDFLIIKTYNCYLCGKRNSKTHVNGIDRIDSNKGYTVENCRACCATCNYIKNNFDLEKLLIKMIRIVRPYLHTNIYEEPSYDMKTLAKSKYLEDNSKKYLYDRTTLDIIINTNDKGPLAINEIGLIKKRKGLKNNKQMRSTIVRNKLSKEQIKKNYMNNKILKKHLLLSKHNDDNYLNGLCD